MYRGARSPDFRRSGNGLWSWPRFYWAGSTFLVLHFWFYFSGSTFLVLHFWFYFSGSTCLVSPLDVNSAAFVKPF